jgi:hypothetical protein
MVAVVDEADVNGDFSRENEMFGQFDLDAGHEKYRKRVKPDSKCSMCVPPT